MLLSRCVFTVAGVSVVVRIPAAAGVLALAVGPAIVGVLAVVGDSVVVGSVADPDPEGSKTFGRIRSVIEINVSDPKIESGSESGSETFIFGSGSDPAKSFGSFRIRIRNTAFVLISKITVGQPR